MKYTRFHTTALCSPTRAALLTGRNHHTVGFASISETATSAPGYTGLIPNHCAPLAKTLQYNGYSTAQFGKCHEVPAYETSGAGPFNHWPTGQGFEHFYGFVGGETHQYYPAVYEGTTPIEVEGGPEDGYHFTADMTDKCINWMLQQKALLPDKPFFCYFAPGATHAPHHVPKEWADKYKGQFAGPDSSGHYSYGWAHAMCTPYQWTKQVASHWGGTRNGMVVHWPNGFKARGEIRHQFAHVIDVAPTVLEAAGLPQPQFVDGVSQTPYHGVSMIYSFDGADAPDERKTQYFEIFCNRGIYHEGWIACTKHALPWDPAPKTKLWDDDWELYNVNVDWTEAKNLAAENPGKLDQLKTLFMLEADKYLVAPLDDRKVERFNAELVGRPELIKGNKQIFGPTMKRLSENSVLGIKNKSHSVTALIVVGDKPAEGTIISQGGKFGGWTLYAKAGKLKYCYNYMSLVSHYAESDRDIPAGEHQVRMEFAYDGGGVGKGGTASLYIGGEKVGECRVDATALSTFSLDETLDVGIETGTSVAEDIEVAKSRFNATIKWVQLDVGDDDHDHLISPEERFHVAMARQ